MNNIQQMPPDYSDWIVKVKQRIAGARQHILLAANETQIRLYHGIGADILDRQAKQGWGSKVIDRISSDLRAAFPDMKGFSTRNLKYMTYFAKSCPKCKIGQQAAARLPWFHIVTLLTKIRDPETREWYAQQAIQQAWSRDTLNAQIKSQLHRRQGAALSNFTTRIIAASLLYGCGESVKSIMQVISSAT